MYSLVLYSVCFVGLCLCVVCLSVFVCLFVVYCVTLYGVLFVMFSVCCVVCVWFVCGRVSGGVWPVVVDCLCTCGLKMDKCVSVFCVGLNS